jgi:hypothetical protein
MSSTADTPHPVQVQAWRKMGASARSQLGIDLRRNVRLWKLAALRAQHPDWPEQRLREELTRIFLHGNG